MANRDIVRKQIDVYRPSILEHGDSPRATFANSRESQDLRFQRMTRLLTAGRSRFSVLDVGAGLCDLHGFLDKRGVEHRYTGTEIVQEMVDLARRKYPGIDIRNCDILADDSMTPHDFVLCSGIFNIPGRTPRDAWSHFVLDMVRRMYELSTVAMTFNFLTSYRTFTDPDLHYTDPREMLNYCIENLSRFVTIDQGYPLYECTMTVLRPETVRKEHPSAIYDKYF